MENIESNFYNYEALNLLTDNIDEYLTANSEKITKIKHFLKRDMQVKEKALQKKYTVREKHPLKRRFKSKSIPEKKPT